MAGMGKHIHDTGSGQRKTMLSYQYPQVPRQATGMA
jgi:hypothetical protein